MGETWKWADNGNLIAVNKHGDVLRTVIEGTCKYVGDRLFVEASLDLYAALEAMVNECESLYKSGRLDAGVWLQARAALRRARGEG